jgi:hypothetical protein
MHNNKVGKMSVAELAQWMLERPGRTAIGIGSRDPPDVVSVWKVAFNDSATTKLDLQRTGSVGHSDKKLLPWQATLILHFMVDLNVA